MDDKKAFGVISALGKKAASQAGALEAFRSAHSAATLADVVRSIHGLPESMMTEFVDSQVTDERWEKLRAKILLAIKLEMGLIKLGTGHGGAGGSGIRPG